jgi:adenylate cyclase
MKSCAPFDTADQAVMAAVVMQQRVQEQAKAGALHNTLSVRIGLHRGGVVREGNDVFGDAVNLAARMAALSKAHQIMTTRQTVEALEGGLRPLARFVDQSTVKGQHGAFDLYEIVWNTSEATMASSGIRPRELAQTVRTWRCGWGSDVDGGCGASRVDHGAQQPVRCARGRHAGLPPACQIEFGKERFVLRDVSTNGTYVQLEDGGARRCAAMSWT